RAERNEAKLRIAEYGRLPSRMSRHEAVADFVLHLAVVRRDELVVGFEQRILDLHAQLGQARIERREQLVAIEMLVDAEQRPIGPGADGGAGDEEAGERPEPAGRAHDRAAGRGGARTGRRSSARPRRDGPPTGGGAARRGGAPNGRAGG